MRQDRLRLCYLANVRFPSERANSIQIMQMCAAFAAEGAEVTLCYPARYNLFRMADAAAGIHAYYGVPERFALKKLFCLDAIDRVPDVLKPPAFRLQSFTFGLSALKEFRAGRETVFYVRDNATLALAARLAPALGRERLFYEAHDFPARPASASMLAAAARRCAGVVAITRGLAARFEEAGLAADRLLVAADGVDLERFADLPSPAEARARLDLPASVPLVVYAGQFFPWKGVDTLVGAAALLAEWEVLLVGGRPEDRARLERLAAEQGVGARVRFAGHVPPSEVPLYLAAADALALPNSAGMPISSDYTSPLKLFEYMASARPIVASDLPSLREVLTDGEDALLVPPDDPPALARGLARLLTESGLGGRLAACAVRRAARYGWRERAGRILRFIQGRLPGTGAES